MPKQPKPDSKSSLHATVKVETMDLNGESDSQSPVVNLKGVKTEDDEKGWNS